MPTPCPTPQPATTSRPLRLLYAGEALQPPLTGIGQYTRELLSAYANLSPADGLAWLGVFDGRHNRPAAEALQATSAQPGPAAARQAGWRRWLRAIPGAYPLRQFEREWRFRQVSPAANLYHETNFILKPFAGPCLTTLYDLSFLTHPECHPRERVRFLERNLARTCAQASRLLTISEFSRQEIIRLLGVAGEHITVTPLAAAARFRPVPAHQAQATLARYGLGWQAYLLSVATLEPRKNLLGLIQAFERLPSALRQRFPLVLAGAPGWRDGPLLAAIERLSARGEAHRLGYVADEDLPALMSGARGFAYPSLYEGFGLPLLEAQACGTAVVAARRSALPEIAAATTLLIDPDDIDSFSQALQQLCEDDALQTAAASAGPALARRYSWAETARQTLKAYHEVLATS